MTSLCLSLYANATDPILHEPNATRTDSHSEPLQVHYNKHEGGVYLRYNEYFTTIGEPGGLIPYSLGERIYVNVDIDNGIISCELSNLDKDLHFFKSFASTSPTGYFQIGAYGASSIFITEIKGDRYENELPDAASEVRVKYINIVETF